MNFFTLVIFDEWVNGTGRKEPCKSAENGIQYILNRHVNCWTTDCRPYCQRSISYFHAAKVAFTSSPPLYWDVRAFSEIMVTGYCWFQISWLKPSCSLKRSLQFQLILPKLKIKKEYVVLCAIWYHLYNFKNVQNTHGRVLL